MIFALDNGGFRYVVPTFFARTEDHNACVGYFSTREGTELTPDPILTLAPQMRDVMAFEDACWTNGFKVSQRGHTSP